MKNLHNKIVIFAISLLATSAAVYMYSPVIKSNAADASVDVNVEVNPIVSLSLDTNALNFSITPTSSGVFESKPIVATVDTNSTGGYELYFSSIDDQTSMTSLTSESTITSTFANTVTSTTMAANTWGYSLDNTDFSKIPTLTNHVALKNLDHLPSLAEKTTTTNIGVKIDSTLASGTYNKKVLFSAVAHPSLTPDLGDITTMQQMTPEICAATTIGEGKTLTDTRDSNTYTVKKLADGKCWMTQNLRIENATATPIDSDTSTTFHIAAAGMETFVFDDAMDHNSVYLDSYGGLYSWYTATGGRVTNVVEAIDTSICPKGWKLPTSGNDSDFATLVSHYSTAEEILGEPNISLSGTVYKKPNDEIVYAGTSSLYWSASSTSDSYARVLSISNNNQPVYMSMDRKDRGSAVRCVAR